MSSPGAQENVRVVGRYALYGAIAAGGMATVHLGRLLGPVGFSRTVAIKRLHAQFATDPEFVSMFLDEARLAARIRHPNVVPTLDVVATGGELFLVMEYVPGESVSRLARALRARKQTIPVRVLSAVMTGVLHGLHAAHEAKDERGHPLGIVHRDVSPQNVLVGTDGVPRVLDFGVAKAAGRMQTTKEGQLKGKLAYMPPEQLRGAALGRQTDIYAAGVMLWELVTGHRLFFGDNEGAIVAKVLEAKIEAPSRVAAATRSEPVEMLDATILRALASDPSARFATAREMALELEKKCAPATASEVADWLESVARDVLDSRAQMVAEIESSASQRPDPARDGQALPVLQTRSAPPEPPPTPTRAHSPQAKSAAALAYQPEAPPFTQPSSISVSSSRGEPSAGARSRRAAAAAAVGILFGLGVLALVFFQRAAPSDPPAREPEPVVSAVPSPVLPPPTASVAAVEDAAPPPSETAATPPKRHGTKRTTVARPGASAKTADECTPPYWYDAKNVKHYKPQCVGN